MTDGRGTSPVPIEDRRETWKRRLEIGDILVLITILSVDLSLLRASHSGPFSTRAGPFLSLTPPLGLLAIMVGFVWRHVPRRWDRPCYVAALILYLLVLGTYAAMTNPLLADALLKAMGIQ